VLRSAAIYGTNASGKTNLFKAAWDLGDLVRKGPDAFWPAGGRLPVFALAPEAARQPTRFEINFLARQGEATGWTRFEYGIGVRAGRVEEEWLNAYPPGGRRQRWFVRQPTEESVAQIHFSASLQGEHKQLRRVTPPSTPFLWVAEKFGHPQLVVPARWLQTNCSNTFEHVRGTTAARWLDDPGFRGWVSDFLRCADLGIVDVRVDRREPVAEEVAGRLPSVIQDLFRRLPQYDVSFTHSTRSGEPAVLKAAEESAGTLRLFELLGPLAKALEQGRVVFVDEISASMHPLLTQRLIEAFNDPRINSKGAQLVLATHDVSLLRGDLFRRDQVWFTEKNPQGETDLYSLHDFQPRADASLEKNYLAGRYGAIPYLGTFDFGTTDGPSQAETRQGKTEKQSTGQTGEADECPSEAGADA
jgi:hypothetical protein